MWKLYLLFENIHYILNSSFMLYFFHLWTLFFFYLKSDATRNISSFKMLDQLSFQGILSNKKQNTKKVCLFKIPVVML